MGRAVECLHIQNNTCVSADEYKRLVSYAHERHIKLSSFKRYSGDIYVIREMIDDISAIAVDFPEIVRGRRAVELSLDFCCGRDIFATTVKHVIYLNAYLYSNIAHLKSEYDLAVSQGKFVAGTDFHSVIRHEVGHVVANIYHIKPLDVAKRILETESTIRVLQYVEESLSLYSAEYPDGKEIISECFSAHYSRVDNEFASAFVKACMRGGDLDEAGQRTSLLDD